MKLTPVLNALAALPGIELKRDEPLSGHTTFKIGGPVSALITPKSPDALANAVKLIYSFGEKPLILGNGSNILASDTPISRIAIKTCGGLAGITVNGELIEAQSGALLSALSQTAQKNALCGLEFAYGIPGSLGGAVSMNAGAYGNEMKDVTEYTDYLDAEGIIRRVSGGEHAFSYRRSRFDESDDIILKSGLRLKHGDPAEIKSKMEELSAKRKNSQPLNAFSAGSTFKRPKEGFAAALIDEAGLKGFAIGGAMVSEKHAGFIINRGDASFSDVLNLIEHVKKTVFRVYGIELEPEVKILRNNSVRS